MYTTIVFEVCNLLYRYSQILQQATENNQRQNFQPLSNPLPLRLLSFPLSCIPGHSNLLHMLWMPLALLLFNASEVLFEVMAAGYTRLVVRLDGSEIRQQHTRWSDQSTLQQNFTKVGYIPSSVLKITKHGKSLPLTHLSTKPQENGRGWFLKRQTGVPGQP